MSKYALFEALILNVLKFFRLFACLPAFLATRNQVSPAGQAIRCNLFVWFLSDALERHCIEGTI